MREKTTTTTLCNRQLLNNLRLQIQDELAFILHIEYWRRSIWLLISLQKKCCICIACSFYCGIIFIFFISELYYSYPSIKGPLSFSICFRAILLHHQHKQQRPTKTINNDDQNMENLKKILTEPQEKHGNNNENNNNNLINERFHGARMICSFSGR